MRRIAATASVALLSIALLGTSSSLLAQRVQSPSAPPAGYGAPGYGNPGYGPNVAPGYAAPGYAASPYGPQGGAVLGNSLQPFDPYALPGNYGSAAPPFPASGFGAPGSPGGYAPGSGFGSAPPSLPRGFGQTLPSAPTTPWPGAPPAFGQPPSGYGPNLPPISRDPYGTPTAPLPSQNPGAAPYSNRGGWGADWQSGFGGNANGSGANPNSSPPYDRLFQDTGLRGTYIRGGDDKNDLGMTEAEVSTTAYFPYFLGVEDGLRVTPGFVFHWTDGPQPPETSDVPGRLYSAYLDLGLNPQFTPSFGAELSARVGVYSDFQEFNSDSIRLLGTGVAVWQTSPSVALKLGGAYINRVKYKFLPAAGFLWTPNAQTRWDVFFPAPKLSNFVTTYGNTQVWWYVGGEYGGGSWTIDRVDTPPSDDRMDINDIRLTLGLEWWDLNRYYGFAEVGYVFDREVVYYRVPGDSLKIDSALMFRAGITW